MIAWVGLQYVIVAFPGRTPIYFMGFFYIFLT